ncbi:cytochrome c biogenesis CcdA family protein [Amphibacillus sediminis]|uniref:cytochrome c biogenesis CcdA family protein n=1 Tax=Amphibacillus sediminis TaxID=360185 RepID=UPI0008326242|nr:cytochrome c biogenesis protein CcdA [Amphibacillus sediminis]
MASATDLTIWLALSAGVMSFLSPCTLPVFPIYLSYTTGISVKVLHRELDYKIRARLLLHAVFFLLGVSSIFFSLGFGATILGQWLQSILLGRFSLFIQRFAGLFLIMMGLIVTGWLKVPQLMKEKRLMIKRDVSSLCSSFLIGLGFAAGWTPCIGPVLASILILTISSPTQGLLYISLYILGFALPFLLLTFFLSCTKWLVKYSARILQLGGVSMILFGFLLFTGQVARLSALLLRFVESTWLTNLG